MLTRAPYDALRAGFRWALPERLNMAAQVLAHPDAKVAIVEDGRGALTYGDLRRMAGRLAAALLARGVGRGDRVGVLRSQDGWCAAAHIAIWQIGAISVPLFKLFGEDALRVRLEDSGAALVITDAESAGRVETPFVPEAETLPNPLTKIADTGPEDPALLIYTSGTTGKPKGALHGHRVLTGHLPGVEMSHDFLGQPGDVLWTPADWAWIGGLFDVLMPGLVLGVPVVAARMAKFDPAECAALIARHGVRNVFFPPTALRMLKAAGTRIEGLRSVASGGEPLGAEMLAWGREALGVTINEFYGQTECNMVASSAASLFPPRPGCIGKPVPGFEVGVIDEEGNESAAEGDIAVRRGAASMMLHYWNNPRATAEKFRGDWMLTGDRGLWEEGYLRFVGRDDDVITTGGYRVGPAEIEDCLVTHPAVATAAVVGKPDPLRTEIVKAYVVLKPGAEADAATLIDWVGTRLSPHLKPREVSFVDSLPMTVTGKIIRKELKRRAAEERP
ncbi:MAG: AMP-dependent synthetase [Alphaproteobacteria bacterium]|nr:MAG: AMP-dependent synthetase [Alphaproteobacteria bacterium]